MAAMTAALYVVLTLASNALGLASGQLQLRLSEALTVLPFLYPAAVPGLFIGCIIANLVTGGLPVDIIFGSLATLAGAFGTHVISLRVKKTKNDTAARLLTFSAPVPTILANTIAIPLILRYAYGIVPLWLSFITVFLSEFLSAGILGNLFLKTLRHRT